MTVGRLAALVLALALSGCAAKHPCIQQITTTWPGGVADFYVRLPAHMCAAGDLPPIQLQ